METLPDLPIAYLAGYEAPLQPEHPDRLARLGISGASSSRNEVRYPNRAFVQIIRPGTLHTDPRAAIAWEMYRIAIGRHQPFSGALEACAAEHDPDNHEFEAAVLRVDGVDHDAVEVREYGLVARAAVVDGWIVVAAVPEGDEPAVELHTYTELAVA